jgi:hypothetical protein
MPAWTPRRQAKDGDETPRPADTSPPRGFFGRMRQGVASTAKRWAKGVAWEELHAALQEVRSSVHAWHLMTAVLMIGVLCVIVEDFALHSLRLLLWTLLGFVSGLGGFALGILSVRSDPEARAEAVANARASCLPAKLRTVIRLIYAAALVGGLIGALLSGGLSLFLAHSAVGVPPEKQVYLLGALNACTLVAFAVRNHVKTRARDGGGWALAHKNWADDNPHDDWLALL